MTNYVRVVNGQVVTTPGPLPKSHMFADFSKTGNFDLMDAATIQAEGFLPLTVNKPTYDARYQETVFSNYTISPTAVVANYTVTTQSLASVKEQVIGNILGKMSALMNGGITYNGNDFATDIRSLVNINIAATAAQIVGIIWSSQWPLVSDIFVTMEQADILALVTAINTRDISLRAQAASAIAAVNALTDQASVMNYVIAIS